MSKEMTGKRPSSMLFMSLKYKFLSDETIGRFAPEYSNHQARAGMITTTLCLSSMVRQDTHV